MGGPMNATGTVHVVDDDPAMRDSLRLLLEASGFTVRTHDSAGAFLTEAPASLGCVLTDVRMPEIDGLELQRRLHARRLPLPVIVMTGQGDIALAVNAMRGGAVDFLEKPFEADALIEAVGRALAQSERLRQADATRTRAAAQIASLTPREREVLDLLVTGLPNKAIASKLGASPRTIEVHRSRVLEKLQVRGLPDLVRLVLAADGA
jgi:two-component system, LuxR family, response regulator FixJ